LYRYNEAYAAREEVLRLRQRVSELELEAGLCKWVDP
jgi:hypothetical protein